MRLPLRQLTRLCISGFAVSLMAACSGENQPAPVMMDVQMTGWPAISGLAVKAGSLPVAAKDGKFSVPASSKITFFAGNVELATISAKQQVTLFDLVDQHSCQSSPELGKLASLLFSLNSGADDANIVLKPVADGAPVKLSSLSEADLINLETTLAGRSLALNDALLKLNAALDQETWIDSGNRSVFDSDVPTLRNYLGRVIEKLPALAMLNQASDAEIRQMPAQFRTQGIAYDGDEIVFSWRYGLQRTDKDYNPLVTRPLAVPDDILNAQTHFSEYDASQRYTPGASHIGDIDISNGKLYAAIEDEDVYNAPYIAVFDARTLAYTGEMHLLPQNLHLEGVPWVSVDAPRKQFYTAEWSNTKVLNVFDLDTFQLIRTVPLQGTVNRVQGAKIYNGMLYAAADTKDTADSTLNTKRKRIYKIDPVTGYVVELFHYDVVNRTEAEGIAFRDTPDGQMHLQVSEPYVSSFSDLYGFNGDDMPTTVYLKHYRRTQAPLRETLCKM